MDTALHASTIAARKTLSDPHANRAVPQLPPYLGDTSPIRIDDVDTMEYLAALDNTEVPTLAVPSAAWGTPPVHRSASPYGSKDFLEAVKFKKKSPSKKKPRSASLSVMGAEDISAGKIFLLSKLDEPAGTVVLTAAAVLILLSPHDSVPRDLSWTALRRSLLPRRASSC